MRSYQVATDQMLKAHPTTPGQCVLERATAARCVREFSVVLSNEDVGCCVSGCLVSPFITPTCPTWVVWPGKGCWDVPGASLLSGTSSPLSRSTSPATSHTTTLSIFFFFPHTDNYKQYAARTWRLAGAVWHWTGKNTLNVKNCFPRSHVDHWLTLVPGCYFSNLYTLSPVQGFCNVVPHTHTLLSNLENDVFWLYCVDQRNFKPPEGGSREAPVFLF